MSNITVSGSTFSQSAIVVYFDVNTGNLYDSDGNFYGNNTLNTFLNNNFILEIHYVNSVTSSNNPEDWEVWEGLSGETVTSCLSFDNDYLHAVKGTLLENIAEHATQATVDVPKITEDTLNFSGTLVFSPFSADSIVSPYTSFTHITGSTFTFELQDEIPSPVDSGAEVRIEDPMYLYIDSDSIYEANIQPQYDRGIFKFPIHVVSRKLLDALDYTGASGVTGTMEHKICVDRKSLIGISVNSIRYNRNAQNDAVVQDVAYHAWTYTNDGITTVRYTKSVIPVLNETVYKKDSSGNLIDAGEIISTASSTSSTTSIKEIGDEISVTYTANSLFDVYTPCLYCYWVKNDDATVGYWTKGNTVVNGTPLYLVSDGDATVQSVTANPIMSTDAVLFRTFTFPFIVRNLVNYNVSIDIPVKDVNWGKEYVLSIIAENIPGVVAFNDAEFVVSDKVYVNEIAIEKVTGLSAILDVKQDIEDAISFIPD